VAGREARLEAQRAGFQNLPVLERDRGIGRGRDVDVKHARAAVHAQQWQIERVQRGRRSVGTLP